jgi:hypothetical protein
MTVERSTAQRIGDVDAMVTSFRRHLRAENNADQTATAYTYAPLQLAEFLRDHGMPAEVAHIHREHVEAFLEDLLIRRSTATALESRRSSREQRATGSKTGATPRSSACSPTPGSGWPSSPTSSSTARTVPTSTSTLAWSESSAQPSPCGSGAPHITRR